jgi:hypothetical protein
LSNAAGAADAEATLAAVNTTADIAIRNMFESRTISRENSRGATADTINAATAAINARTKLWVATYTKVLIAIVGICFIEIRFSTHKRVRNHSIRST